jgi:hypothetical protein
MDVKQVMRAVSIACVLSIGAGCTSTAPTKPVADLVAERSQVTFPSLSGKSVALDLGLFQRAWKDSGLHTKGQSYTDDDVEIKVVERVSDADMTQNWVVQDVRLSLKTNEQLDYFEQSVESSLTRSGVLIADQGKSDYTLVAQLTFGPTPAPSFGSYNLGKSLGMGLLTLGLGPDSHSAQTDFDVLFRLQDASGNVISEYSKTVQQEEEFMKHPLNISGGAQVLDSAMELFRASLETQLEAFSTEVSRSCSNCQENIQQTELQNSSSVNSL